jgi:hypothetical protein
MQDVIARGRNHRLTRTACKNGHDYTPENTKIASKNGRPYRQCVTCSRRASREHERRRRAAENLRRGAA